MDVIHHHGYLTVKLKVEGQQTQPLQKGKQDIDSCDVAIFTYEMHESGLRPTQLLVYQRPYTDKFLQFVTSRHYVGGPRPAHCRWDVYTLSVWGYAISVCRALDLQKRHLRSLKNNWDIKSEFDGPDRSSTKQLVAINAVAAATIIIDDAPPARHHKTDRHHETVWEKPRDADQILSIPPYHGPFSCDGTNLKGVQKEIKMQFCKVRLCDLPPELGHLTDTLSTPSSFHILSG